jgi:nucleotide-binding universal stress UspA family protein
MPPVDAVLSFEQRGEALFDGPIVWALDAFPDQPQLHLQMAAALAALAPHAHIHPVYVLSEESFADRGFSTFLKPALKPMALKAINQLLSEVINLNLRPPRVLTEASASGAACAKKLARFAERIGANLIAAGSHGRSGFSRLIMGSFSEKLLDRNRLPVLIAGPQAQHLNQLPTRLLFVTDGAHGCLQAYQRALHTAANAGADMHVFWRARGRCNHDTWHQPADALGVRLKVIDNSARKTTAASILDYVDYLDPSTTLVAMTGQYGVLANAFSGGLVREVIRLSPSPIYMMPQPH